MLKQIGLAVAVGSLLAALAEAAPPKSEPVSPEEARAWIHYAVPLPKRIEIASKVVVAPATLAVAAPEGSGPVVAQAVRELRESVGLAPEGAPPPSPAFTVILQMGGKGADDLRGLKNAGQACRIAPAEDGAGLRLIAVAPPGLYYAAKTLQQLLRAKAAGGKVEVPLLNVTDWPDFEDRGLWGADSFLRVRWMADRKMNYIEQIFDVGVEGEGRFRGLPKSGHDPMIRESPLYAMKPVPVVLHLEQVSDKGVYQHYPQLTAQGGQAGALCYAQPAAADVVGGWIAALAELPGVSEVDVWLTENLHGQGGCRCAACAKTKYAVGEARAVLAGWRRAREKVPNVGLRVLTSEATEADNPDVFGELPPAVKIWYYHSLFTYDEAEIPMLRPYLAKAARAGRWIGVVPSLTTIHFAQPFTSAAFVRYRLTEFADKGMSGLMGYVTPRVSYAAFNVEAAAEWAWNAKGRSTREFALAWAVRQGLRDPDRFAEWSETLGPVTWDLYGSDWPAGEVKKRPAKVSDRLRRGELGDLGSSLWGLYRSPWGDIKTVEQLAGDAAAADRAVALAREMDVPTLLLESRIAQGYIRALQALWELRRIVKPSGIAAEHREAARRHFQQYVDALSQAAEALPEWEKTIPGRPADARFTDKPVGVARDAVKEMKAVADGFGIDIP